MNNNRNSLADWQRQIIRQILGEDARSVYVAFTVRRPE